jgi:hypothetical protein
VIDLILVGILTATVIVLSALLIINKKERDALSDQAFQMFLDNQILLGKIEQHSVSSNIEQTEGFVKFLSESRDWAFQYIETTQSEIKKFVEIVGPQMEYYDKYGRIINSVHTKSMDKIFDAYQELVSLLPETTKQGENNE